MLGRSAFGAVPEAGGTRFSVFAPERTHLEIVLVDDDRVIELAADGEGRLEGWAPGVGAGARYWIRADDRLIPDPASRFQPNGVHSASEVIDPRQFDWRTDWQGRARRELVFYELHVGTFSERGDYDGVRERLPYLADLGITAIELMPLHDFPGDRNWGYDPAAMFAPARRYGRPEALARLVDEAHAHGIAVFLDVVYNHFGPDGAYAVVLAPQFFSRTHHTLWGRGINLDGPGSLCVRQFFLQNARMWMEDYRLDGLRLDAVFALADDGPLHFLSELSQLTATLPGPPRLLFAEDHRNERRLIEPCAGGGYGLDGIWSDDFHHQLQRLLTAERHGYYGDFTDRTADLATCISQGWLYQGETSAHYGVPRGTSPEGVELDRLVFCLQNHDQVGNRPGGDRLSESVVPAEMRAATCLLLLAPELPLLFMGQEWAASTPFHYFTDHRAALGREVAAGRRRELARFTGRAVYLADPQDPQAFASSRLDWPERDTGEHARVLALHRDLLHLRQALPAEARAESPVEGGLLLWRGPRLFLVALRDDVALPVPAGARLGWMTETPAYAADPTPPKLEGNVLWFSRPGGAEVVLPGV